MPSNYQGNKDAVQSPSPAPGPFVKPTVATPSGTDALNSGSVQQPFKTPNDFIAHMQSAIGLDVPVLSASTNGFTVPTYTAFGGTVTPSGLVHQADGTRFMIQIQTGGAVGAATFKTSMDGGNTYGALQTTAASMTDATSGITLAFSGTFTANGTAAFRSAFTPMLQQNENGGNPRFVVDHVGMPGGPYAWFREEWRIPFTQASTAVVSVNPMWKVTIAGTPIGAQAPSITGTVYGGCSCDLTTLATTGNEVAIATNAQQVNASATGIIWTLEWDTGLDAIGGNGLTVWGGLSGSQDPNSPSGGYIWFRKATGNTNWQCETNDGATTNTFDSGVAPVLETVTLQHMKIELYGSATQTGQKIAKFFIDGRFVGSSAVNLPTGTLYVAFACRCTASGTGHDNQIGIVELKANRLATGSI